MSFIGTIILDIEVELFYHLSRKFNFFARYSGIVMFMSFPIYMSEIMVQNTYYKLYEGFIMLGSVEFLMSISLTVDIWICPIAVFFISYLCILKNLLTI